MTDVDARGNSAIFRSCKSLGIAEGQFPGFVDFGNSGVESVANLHIARANADGFRADFTNCTKIRILPKKWHEPDVKLDDLLRKEQRAREFLKEACGRGTFIL